VLIAIRDSTALPQDYLPVRSVELGAFPIIQALLFAMYVHRVASPSRANRVAAFAILVRVLLTTDNAAWIACPDGRATVDSCALCARREDGVAPVSRYVQRVILEDMEARLASRAASPVLLEPIQAFREQPIVCCVNLDAFPLLEHRDVLNAKQVGALRRLDKCPAHLVNSVITKMKPGRVYARSAVLARIRALRPIPAGLHLVLIVRREHMGLSTALGFAMIVPKGTTPY
jgi:hypothetical protein